MWLVGRESSPPLGDSTNTHNDRTWMKGTAIPVCHNSTQSFALSLAQPLHLRLASQLSGSDIISSPGSLNMLVQERPAGVGAPLSLPLGCTDAFTMPASTFIQQPIPTSKPAWLLHADHSLTSTSLVESVAPLETIPGQAMAPPEPFSMESLIARIPIVSNRADLPKSLLSCAVSQAPLARGPRSQAARNAADCVDAPSGQRRLGDGIDDSIQSLICVQQISVDCTVVFVTLLVSGFIIGPKGASIREIQKYTGAHIRSYNKNMFPSQPRLVRAFTVQGSSDGQALALSFFRAAIDRYKYLAEGACRGMRVPHVQNINGIDFFYSPPPKNIVPHAAGLHPLDDSERNLCLRATKAKKTQEAADRLQAILNTHFK